MEVIYVIIYLIICVAIAYFVGLEKRIGFGYAFLFSFLLTPILGIIISFLTQKIKLNEKTSKAFRIIGGLLFIPVILTTSFQFKVTTQFRFKVTTLFRSKLTTPFFLQKLLFFHAFFCC